MVPRVKGCINRRCKRRVILTVQKFSQAQEFRNSIRLRNSESGIQKFSHDVSPPQKQGVLLARFLDSTRYPSRTSYVVRLHFLLGFLKTCPFFAFSVFAKNKNKNTFSENRVKIMIVNGTTYETSRRAAHPPPRKSCPTPSSTKVFMKSPLACLLFSLRARLKKASPNEK